MNGPTQPKASPNHPADAPLPGPPIDELTRADAKAFMAAFDAPSKNQSQASGDSDAAAGEPSAVPPIMPSQTASSAGGVTAASHEARSSWPLYAAVIALIILALTVTLVTSLSKPSGTSTNSAGILSVPNAPNATGNSGLSNQVKQDVKTCSNVVNAALMC